MLNSFRERSGEQRVEGREWDGSSCAQGEEREKELWVSQIEDAIGFLCL